MQPLDLQSERYSATGNLASVGVLNQLGRPGMDRLTVLVREAVQNGWDAKLPENPRARFGISGWALSIAQRELLKNLVFSQIPPGLGLAETLDSPADFMVLALYDRGTSGLGGPTRADMPDYGHESRDFVDFLRNVGQPPDKALGGGTFGYGKAALYLSSLVRTILAHTHCTHNGKLASRFIGAALGPQHKGTGTESYLFTGRHWWGRLVDNVAEPLTGIEADELASRLGLPDFAAGERGTTILLLQPVFDNCTPLQAMHYIATTLLFNFWPKMIRGKNGTPAMSFELIWQGQPVFLPEPENFPPLEGFVKAMQTLKMDRAGLENDAFTQLVEIASRNPKKHLGLLSLHKFPRATRSLPDIGSFDSSFAFPNLCHHVALMRPAELVVKYLAGPALPTDKMEYAGVFVVDEAVDRVFARAEPPTHDDWVPQFLEQPNDQTYVRVAIRRIQEKMEEFVSPPPVISGSTTITPLGSFAGYLGGLLLGQEGPGLNTGDEARTAGSTRSNGAGTGNGSKIKLKNPLLTIRDEGRLEMINNFPALVFTFEVESVSPSGRTLIKAHTGAILDSGDFENEPPVGGRVPTIISWYSPNNRVYPGTSELYIPYDERGLWRIAVTIPNNIVVGLDLSVMEAPE